MELHFLEQGKLGEQTEGMGCVIQEWELGFF